VCVCVCVCVCVVVGVLCVCVRARVCVLHPSHLPPVVDAHGDAGDFQAMGFPILLKESLTQISILFPTTWTQTGLCVPECERGNRRW
jgi:hypothetical protein